MAVIEAHTHYSPPAMKVGEFDVGVVQEALDLHLSEREPTGVSPGYRVDAPQEVVAKFRKTIKPSTDYPPVSQFGRYTGYFYEPMTEEHIPTISTGEFGWHFDLGSNLEMPAQGNRRVELLIAATLFGLDTLQGRVDLPEIKYGADFWPDEAIAHFLGSPEGTSAINEALEGGDLEEPSQEFNAGDIVLLPKGTIHRRPHKAHSKQRALFKSYGKTNV